MTFLGSLFTLDCVPVTLTRDLAAAMKALSRGHKPTRQASVFAEQCPGNPLSKPSLPKDLLSADLLSPVCSRDRRVAEKNDSRAPDEDLDELVERTAGRLTCLEQTETRRRWRRRLLAGLLALLLASGASALLWGEYDPSWEIREWPVIERFQKPEGGPGERPTG